jgi:hypothetical protein
LCRLRLAFLKPIRTTTSMTFTVYIASFCLHWQSSRIFPGRANFRSQNGDSFANHNTDRVSYSKRYTLSMEGHFMPMCFEQEYTLSFAYRVLGRNARNSSNECTAFLGAAAVSSAKLRRKQLWSRHIKRIVGIKQAKQADMPTNKLNKPNALAWLVRDF